jgi:hypothetical protein
MDNSTIPAIFTNISVGGYFSSVEPLLILIAGIVIYSFFVFNFYRSLASPDIFKLELHLHAKKFGEAKDVMHVLLYIFENIILVPLLVFLWFIILAILLLIVSKTQSPQTVLVTAFSFVAGARIMCYYSEELAREMAKIVPFTLLGIFLLDYVTAITVQVPAKVVSDFFALWPVMIYYLISVAVIEIVLRVIRILINLRNEG